MIIFNMLHFSPRYNELLQIPEKQRKSKDCILILLLQKILEFNEHLNLVSKQQKENTRCE